MDKLNKFYPVFVPDQVLTNKSLNHAFSYLDQQNRATRSGLIGHGIVCGLDYTLRYQGTSSEITINPGHGSTIEGLLLQFPTQENGNPFVYKYVRRYVLPPDVVSDEHLSDPDATGDITGEAVKTVITADGVTANTRPLKIKLGNLFGNAYELLAENESVDGEEVIPLSQIVQEDDYILFLYLEITDLKSENCSPEDCDDKGKIRTMRVVPLLAGQSDHVFDQQDYSVPQQMVTRAFRLMDYESQQSTQALTYAYTQVTSQNAGNVGAKLRTILADANAKVYNSGSQQRENALIGRMEEIILSFKNFDNGLIQYYYDFLADLELAAIEYCQYHNCRPVTTCSFSSYRHPRVLALGSLNSSFSGTDVFRYRFVEAAGVQEEERFRGIGYKLYNRLWVLIEAHLAWLDSLNTEIQDTIVVSPSRSAPSPLGDRAVPYYYKSFAPTEFMKYWNAHNCSNRSMLDIYGYNNYGTGDLEISNRILDFGINEYNFFRIEGHIGQDVNVAEKTLNDLINAKNLPFRTFRLLLKNNSGTTNDGTSDKATIKKLAASSAKLRKSAGIDVQAAKVTLAGEQPAQISFENLNDYMQNFAGIGPDGVTLSGGSGTAPGYNANQFRLNTESISTNPRIITVQDQRTDNTRQVVLRVVGTDVAGGIGNEIFPGETFTLQVIYGKDYLVYATPDTPAAEKAIAAPADEIVSDITGVVNTGGGTTRPYTAYNFPPLTVVAAAGDNTSSIAYKLVEKIQQFIRPSYNIYPRPSDIIISATSNGDSIYIEMNNPPLQSYLYYVSPSARGVDSNLVHYLSIEYIGGGTLVSPVEITVCYSSPQVESNTATKVRMLSGTSIVDFPRDVNAYLTSPAIYEICGVTPLVFDTGGGGEIDNEYNIWPFDAKGNLLYNIFKGAEHLGGVYRGGTFIFLTEMQGDKGTEFERVVGDIALPWDIEFIKLSRAVSLKFNRKYWKWGNAWETFPPVFIK